MFDAVTYGAAVGAAKRYTDEHSGSDDAVKYTEQSLTSEQQAQARENIGAAASDDIPTDAVKYTAQTLTDAQKSQARTNIGAVQSDWNAYRSENPDFIKNKPLVKVGQGTGGNLISGTGLENNTNEAKKLNSIAHGRNVTANGNYSIAVGQYVQANNDYEIAYGKFNQSNADTAFSIGDGADTQNRHNLMELKADGTLLLNGNAVKTEGEDDNKLRLGQICGMKFTAGNSANHLPVYGFSELCKKNNPSTNYVKYVTFSSDDTATIESSLYVYQFGDFVGYITSPTLSAASVSVKVQPLRGRTLGKPTTGKWISVENCYFMFIGCREVESLDLSMFDTSKVTNMSTMFYGCLALSSLDLTSFDTGKVINMVNMFYSCTALTTLDISSFDLTNVTAYGGMFGSSSSNCPPLTTLKTPKINPHDDIPLNQTLYSQDGTAYTNLPVTTGTSIELRQSWT